MQRFEFLRDMTAADYHADPCETPSLSATCAKTLIERSPQRAHLEHPKFGGTRRVSSSSMDRGTIVHSLVLEQPLDVQVLDYPDYRTKAAQHERDAALNAGKTPVLEREMGPYYVMASTIRGHIANFGIALDGQSEGTVLWEDEDDNGFSVKCRSRMDHCKVKDGTFWVIDLKTTSDASPKTLNRHILNFGYDLQAAAYTRAIANVAPEWAGRIKFLFLFAEDEPPYPVTPILLDGAFMALGLSKWRRAVNLWSQCLRSGIWPGYASETLFAHPPQWAIREEIEASPSHSAELGGYLEF